MFSSFLLKVLSGFSKHFNVHKFQQRAQKIEDLRKKKVSFENLMRSDDTGKSEELLYSRSGSALRRLKHGKNGHKKADWNEKRDFQKWGVINVRNWGETFLKLLWTKKIENAANGIKIGIWALSKRKKKQHSLTKDRNQPLWLERKFSFYIADEIMKKNLKKFPKEIGFKGCQQDKGLFLRDLG